MLVLLSIPVFFFAYMTGDQYADVEQRIVRRREQRAELEERMTHLKRSIRIASRVAAEERTPPPAAEPERAKPEPPPPPAEERKAPVEPAPPTPEPPEKTPVEPPGEFGENARVAALREKLADLEQQLKVMREQTGRSIEDSAEIRMMADELAQIGAKLKDNKNICFDFCIEVHQVRFNRVMRRHRIRISTHGYYTCLNGVSPMIRNHLYEPVDVSYTCDDHHVVWTKETADEYRRNGYIPRRDLERRENELKRSIVRERRRAIARREARMAKVAKEIERVRYELMQARSGEAQTAK